MSKRICLLQNLCWNKLWFCLNFKNSYFFTSPFKILLSSSIVIITTTFISYFPYSAIKN